MSPYPIGYEADFAEQRSRLTTFFRYFMAIPLMIVAIFYGIGLLVCTVIAWFSIMFTAKYPAGLYEFSAGASRYLGRMSAYLRLITDVYPPFDGGEHPEYPVRISFAPPLESYSRLKTFFRYILAIPVMLIAYALGILGNVCAFLSWVLIVITGKQAKGLQDALNLANAYGIRASGYYTLLVEDWPPFSVQDASSGQPAPTA
ncbi:MAG: DUF4389 domain-containing protein [Solirubrobacteraceae bacterium]